MGSYGVAGLGRIINKPFALFAAALLGFAASMPVQAAVPAITVIGVDQAGNKTPVTNYRWTIEEDVTKASVPGQHAGLNHYSFSFHSSYMPVVAAGKVKTGAPVIGNDCGDANDPLACADPDRAYVNPASVALDSAKRYYISILPDQGAGSPVGTDTSAPTSGYQLGGAAIAPGQTAVTIYVNKYPVPTAQITVFVFQDNNPINAQPDLPQEQGLAGFNIVVSEAGGTYGGSGGQVTQDAFGNPLGTTYVTNPDGTPVLDVDFKPTVKVRGNGIILSGPDGTATIKHLFPAKYTIQAVPPAGSDWHQTTTIEGTKGDDAWVKNGEPPFFQEFGPPGHHVFTGFVHSGFLAQNANNTPVLNGNKTILGRVVNIHNSRAPDYTFYAGAPVPQCWVGLNEPNGGRALYAAPCYADSTFSIPNVPAGNYEIVIWDEPLDSIIATAPITVAPADNVVDLLDVPVFSWFAKYEGRVFLDTSVSPNPGTPDDANLGKPFDVTGNLKPGFGEGVPLNIRFRDGSIYQSVLTNPKGEFQFTELFPFFNWMIAEVDYARYRATGATIVVDAGGPVPPHDPSHDGNGGWVMPSFDKLNPQTQIAADGAPVDGALYKTETGVVLLEGIQTFLGQTNHIEFGKAPWKGDENGGIAGIVQYSITRAEDDPKNGTAETWEPGIPRVQVNLFIDCDGDGKPDKPVDLSVPGAVAGTCAAGGLSGANGYVYDKPDVDNYPFCWRDPGSCTDALGNPLTTPQKGPEDKQQPGHTGSAFNYGDVVKWGSDPDNAGAPYIGLGKTDGWDDAIPTGCRPDTYGNGYSVPYGADKGKPLDCYDGLRVWNQIRPAVFDGGYAFGIVAGQSHLPNVKYIVEAVAPPGYFHQSNGDKNVVFGDALAPAPAATPYECVGIDLPVPQFLSLFPGQQQGNPLYTGPGQTAKKCDMKLLDMQPGRNPAPNFFLYTEAPVAGHGVGFILDDMSSEFDVNAPTFGEKHAPPHLPISIRDWTGRELSRVYADEFGSFNFLVPSTFTINPPFPSGVGPNMVVACMNHPGPITNDPVTGLAYAQPQIDPFFSRQYSQFCYTLQYLPGKTTYLDTPVVPVAAYAGTNQNPLDCEFGEGTPQIYSVSNSSLTGPYLTNAGGQLTIISVGSVDVSNPYYDPNLAGSTKTIQRDYGFGAQGPGSKVTLNGVSLAINTWGPNGITVTVPAGAASGQLMVTRAGGATTQVGVAVTVENRVPKLVPAGGSIQAVIDNPLTVDGDLILIPPGTYNEFVIVDKKVQLQGWGAPSVTINAAKSSTLALKNWRSLLNKKVDARCGTPTGSTDIANCPAGTPIDPDTGQPTVVAGANRTFDILPGQTLGHNTSNNEPLLFGAEEGPGILVVAKQNQTGTGNGHFTATRNARIDGITVTGADYGGGILASGYARFLDIGNNRVVSNYGTYGGGIRIGHTELLDETNTAFGGYTNSVNNNVRIHNNWVSQNGSTELGFGGGIALGNGSTNYLVSRNYICGNFSMGDGGGIGHLGVSTGGEISNNTVIFNQTFNQSANPTGGGIFVGGAVSVAGGLSPGSGDNLIIDANLVQGNNAGAGAGGGIRLAQINGLDVPGRGPGQWNKVTLTNNIIVDNVAGYVGGGVSLVDALRVNIANNTIVNNDSTATNQQAFTGPGTTQSIPQPAGLVSEATSTVLLAAMTNAQRNNNRFSNPTALVDNIIWHNRSFCWAIDYGVLSPTGGPTFGLFDSDASGNCLVGTAAGTNPTYRDLAVIGVAGQLSPTYSILTNTTGYAASNIQGPTAFGDTDTTLFKKQYAVGSRNPSLIIPGATTTLDTAATTDEGGNFIDIRFGPITPWNCPAGPCKTLFGDYHVASGTSPAVNVGTNTGASGHDFDGQGRPAQVTADIGADEFVPPSPVVSLSAASLAFGNQPVNTTSAPQTVTVANIGDAPLTFTTITISGNFAIASGTTCVNGGTVAVGASCVINVTFTPLAAGGASKTGTLTLNDNAMPSPQTVSLSGTRVQGTVRFTSATLGSFILGGTTLNFGNLSGLQTSVVTLTVTVAPVTFTSATVSGILNTAYSKGVDTCSGTTVPVGGTCTIAVQFNAPTNNSLRAGTLTVNDNGTGNTQILGLTGS